MKLAALGALLAATVLAASTAHAALPPEEYQEVREQAPHHLQVRLERITLLRGLARANCEVEATVLRDFRGALPEGTPLRFALNCIAPRVRPMPGPNAWHGYEELKSATVAEGFFRGEGEDVAPAYGQLGFVPGEREWPWCEAQSGRCDLPPPEPPQVLECSTVGLSIPH